MPIMPDIICAQETKLKFNKTFYIKNYTPIRKDRSPDQATGGGVAICIKINMRHTFCNTNNNLEIIKITGHHTNGDIDILNVYNPPKTLINVQAYNELITIRNTILVGDFNALNTIWQANCTNVNGCILDLNKAFDRLDHFTLIKNLQDLNITGNIYRYIHSFISNRTATIKIKNKLYDKFNIYAGLPQGSIISLTLFLLLLHDIPLPIQKNLFISLFADDVAIWCVDNTIDLIINILQPYIDILATYFTLNKLIISQDKTIGVVFLNYFKIIICLRAYL